MQHALALSLLVGIKIVWIFLIQIVISTIFLWSYDLIFNDTSTQAATQFVL